MSSERLRAADSDGVRHASGGTWLCPFPSGIVASALFPRLSCALLSFLRLLSLSSLCCVRVSIHLSSSVRSSPSLLAALSVETPHKKGLRRDDQRPSAKVMRDCLHVAWS